MAGFQVTFDAADPKTLGDFWAEVLGYVEQPPPPGFDSWEAFGESINLPPERWNDYWALIDPSGHGARLFFQRVPEGKTAKNRVHLDVNVGAGREGSQRQAAVRQRAAELVELGATEIGVVDEPHGWCVVMQDPEGNEFCLQ